MPFLPCFPPCLCLTHTHTRVCVRLTLCFRSCCFLVTCCACVFMPWGPWRASPFSFLFCLAPFVCRSVCLWAGFEAPVCLRAYLCACSLSHIGVCFGDFSLRTLLLHGGGVCEGVSSLCALPLLCLFSLSFSVPFSRLLSALVLLTTHYTCVLRAGVPRVGPLFLFLCSSSSLSSLSFLLRVMFSCMFMRGFWASCVRVRGVVSRIGIEVKLFP